MRARDRRPVFAVPHGRYVYVGTTDTSYEGPLEEPPVMPEDAEYLLDAVARTFDGPAVSAREVIGAWAGLRPLVHEEGKRPSEISRKDEIVVSVSGLVTIAGGKLTTYRRMAERVVETAATLLGRTLPASTSATLPLTGGDLAGATSLAQYATSPTVRDALDAVPDDVATRLLGTYGNNALEVVAAGDRVESLRPLMDGAPLSEAEVRYAVRAEMARTVADVLERRSRLALFATESARAVAPQVADIMAEELGWSDGRRAAELAAFDRAAIARLAWRDCVSSMQTSQG
jgi:glycerol-3-phosphate dehydrogenase